MKPVTDPLLPDLTVVLATWLALHLSSQETIVLHPFRHHLVSSGSNTSKVIDVYVIRKKSVNWMSMSPCTVCIGLV